MNEPLKKGSRVGREYLIESVIGRGGFVTAYKVLKESGKEKRRCILKEVAPVNLNLKRGEMGEIICPKEERFEFEEKKKQFQEALLIEEKIRLLSPIVNELSGSARTFEYGGTLYAEVPYYKGEVLADTALSFLEQVKVTLAAARTILAFHREGFLVLDLKPQNVFVLQDALRNPVTEMVLFIDTGSIVKKNSDGQERLSFTESWAAPEQIQGQKRYLISERTDLYALGEWIFFFLFKRHSKASEHRGFSNYPFWGTPELRLEAQNLLRELFRGTLRTSPENRFESVEHVIEILEKLRGVLEEEVFPVSRRPGGGDLIGRMQEKTAITNQLRKDGYVFVCGSCGMGKTALIEGWMKENVSSYSEMVYLKYAQDIFWTFNRDFSITTVRKYEAETEEEFFLRKLEALKVFAKKKSVLVVIDSFIGPVTKEMESILYGPFDVIVSGIEKPPEEYGVPLCVEALEGDGEQKRLFEKHLGRRIRKAEEPFVEAILENLCGHTLLILLLAKQVAASHMKMSEAAELVENPGFTEKFQEEVSLRMDAGEESGRIGDILKKLLKRRHLKQEMIDLLQILQIFSVPMRFEKCKELALVGTFDYS